MISKEEYAALVKEKSPNSPLVKDMIKAFIIGGLICCVGQIVHDLYVYLGVGDEEVKTAVPVTMVFLGTLFTGMGLYDKLAKHAGAGTLVPITGFANAMAAPAIDFKCEGFILGVGTKMFSIAGPVIVYGTSSGVLYGFIYWLVKKAWE